MPVGKRISEETRVKVVKLRAQDLSYKIISMRTGLHWSTVVRILKQDRQVSNKS